MENQEIEILNDFLDKYKINVTDTTNFNFKRVDIENKLSYQSYQNIKSELGDLPKARYHYKNDNENVINNDNLRVVRKQPNG